MSEVIDIIMVTKQGDKSGNNLFNKLTEHGVKVQRVYIDGITLESRKKLLKAIITRFYEDLDELLIRNVEQYFDLDYIQSLKLSEFIELVANNPRVLRAPIILNQYNEIIVGSSRHYTIEDYTGGI